MFCSNCGKEVNENADVCLGCGKSLSKTKLKETSSSNDTGSIGWWFLGFFFATVGLILFLVWKDEKPLSAKRAGWGALTSVIVSVCFSIIAVIISLIVVGTTSTFYWY